MSARDDIARIEAEIVEVKKRFPKHSTPPSLYAELEDLEDKLADARQAAAEEEGGGEAAAD